MSRGPGRHSRSGGSYSAAPTAWASPTPAPTAGASPHPRTRPGPAPLTSGLPQRPQVDGDVVLRAAQGAVAALQVIPVAGVLGDPLDLVAAVGLGRELGKGALWETVWEGANFHCEHPA